MTQEAIAVSTTPPLPGLQMVQQVNAALQTIATDFAGPDDPAALAGPFMVWADSANMLLKRRNAAGSDWVVIGQLFKESLSKQDNLAGLTSPSTARNNLGLGTAATADAANFTPLLQNIGEIGSYSFLQWGGTASDIPSGAEATGANLRYARADGGANTTPVGGTWKNMGGGITGSAGVEAKTTLFKRMA